MTKPIIVHDTGEPDLAHVLRASEHAQAYVPCFKIANADSFGVSDDGASVVLKFAGLAGDVQIEMPADQIESLVVTLGLAKTAAASIADPKAATVPVRSIAEWEIGWGQDGTVFLTLNKNSPAVMIFGLHPNSALEIGRAIVQSAIQGAQHLKRIIRARS